MKKVEWFEGLFSDIERDSLRNALIVSWSYHDHSEDKTYRLYTTFKSYLEYGMFSMKLSPHERCFYEIILGEGSQKPHFDIDIDTSKEYIAGEIIKDDLIDNIIRLLQERKVNLTVNDILLFTSHGADKQSYHVIVNNYCHANNIEARAFYDALMDSVKTRTC
jgi:hypothetical protein